MPKSCVEVGERAGSPEEASWAGQGEGRAAVPRMAANGWDRGVVETDGLAFLLLSPAW